MKQISIFFANVILISLFTSSALAVNNQGQGNGNPQGNENQQGNQVVEPIQNQNQIQTQNMGEEQQLQVQTQLQQQDGSGPGSQLQKQQAKKLGVDQSMSQVAQQVQKLLQTRSAAGGIGDQVRVWAQNQNQSQQKIQQHLSKIDQRQGLVRSIIGPNYGSLNEIKKEMQQNRVRVQQLEQLKTQLQNEGDITNVQEMINLMQQQNTSLQEKIKSEENNSGLFGWLFKLFAAN